jgi:membrane protein YqaA with SNARE-associated domain
MSASLWSTALGYYAAAIVSAVVPWVNGELLMISAVPLVTTRAALAALVVAVTAGQMTGKTVMYWASRKSARPRSARVQGSIERWRERLQQRPRSVLAVIFLSALIGIPPFFIVSVAAGAIGLAFPRFLAVGTAGRLAHFTIVAFVPEFVGRML